MDTINIPQLAQAPDGTEVVSVAEFLDDLDTLTPVRGRLQVKHKGNYLQVSGQAETIVTFTCDRCLQNYNHRLAIDTSELIWLDAAAERPYSGPLEQETPLEDLVETLSPQGEFHPGDWLYEQLCLELPPRKLCNEQCPGIATAAAAVEEEVTVDRRWASLEALKQQLS